MAAKGKNLSGKIVDDVIALIKVNVNGGYHDHICYNETKKPIGKSDFDILYNSQKVLRSTGGKRAKLKNSLDNRLREYAKTFKG